MGIHKAFREYMDKYLTDYKKYLLELDKSNGTVYCYSYYLYRFLRDIGKFPNDDFSDFTKLKGLEYIRGLESKELSIRTVHKYIDSINSFFKFKSLNIHFKKKQMQSLQFVDNVISDEEAKRLLYFLKDNGKDELFSLVSVLYHTGLRIGEAIKITDKDLKEKAPYTFGKGKARRFFINEQLLCVLDNYIKKYHIKGNLWANSFGSNSIEDDVSSKVNKLLKRYGTKIGIDKKKLHCHSFRHLFCIRLIRAGMSISDVCSIVGHSNVSITMIYLRKSEEELFDLFNKIGS